MIRYWVGIAALLAGCCLPNLAMGRSCIAFETAGFIHAKATHLPSNARGALFLPPSALRPAIAYRPDGTYIYGIAPQPLQPSDFTITSDAHPGFLPLEIVALDLQRDADSAPAKRAFRFASKEAQTLFEKDPAPVDWDALLKSDKVVEISDTIRAAGLLRVGPVGGFKAGAHYTITYTGKRDIGWVYPARVEYTIDAAALRTDGAKYRLALDGLAERQMLQMPLGSAYSGYQPATVQNFHYVLPDSHEPYRDSLLYFSEKRGEPADASCSGGFTNLHHRSSECEMRRFGETARGPGVDLISAACGPNAGRATIRGWVGMLEVEDRLRSTEAVLVDFDNTNGGSCSAHGMLKQAFGSGDARRIENAVCATNGPYGVALPAGDVPDMTDLFSLASSGSERARACAREALAGYLIGVPALRAPFLDGYARLLGSDLASSDPAIADHAETNLKILWRFLVRTAPPPPEPPPAAQELLEPVLPALLSAVVSGTPARSRSASETIIWLGKDAKPLAPALLAAAEPAGAGAANAAHALVAVIPQDPRLHRILLRHAADPAQLAGAALDYNRVAGNDNPAKAIGLLSEAARLGNVYAIFALGEHGLAARASVPTLIAIMKDGGGNGSAAFNALLKVSDGEPKVLAAFADIINAAPDKEKYFYEFDKLAKFKEQGQVFLPAIALRMQRPMREQRKASLKTIIESMALPPAQQSEWLARLDKVTLDSGPY
jgi:hypothetical protein